MPYKVRKSVQKASTNCHVGTKYELRVKYKVKWKHQRKRKKNLEKYIKTYTIKHFWI